MQAIMVINRDGYYEIPGAAEVEDWDAVKADAISVKRRGDLMGWGQYTGSYTVQFARDDRATYFVAEDEEDEGLQ